MKITESKLRKMVQRELRESKFSELELLKADFESFSEHAQRLMFDHVYGMLKDAFAGRQKGPDLGNDITEIQNYVSNVLGDENMSIEVTRAIDSLLTDIEDGQ